MDISCNLNGGEVLSLTGDTDDDDDYETQEQEKGLGYTDNAAHNSEYWNGEMSGSIRNIRSITERRDVWIETRAPGDPVVGGDKAVNIQGRDLVIKNESLLSSSEKITRLSR